MILKFKTHRHISPNSPHLATPSEQQILFDALAKEGKKWNAEKLCIENLEKDILVPESIGIYKNATSGFGDRLFIGFNDNKQFLGYNSETNQWMVFTHVDCLEKVQCKLTPCKREELKKGDTAYFSNKTDPEFNDDFDSTFFYCKILSDEKFANINNDEGVGIGDRRDFNWYKVEPIQ